MKRRTFVHLEAQADIREAALWYESREASLGIRFIGEVRTSLQHIADNPLRFPIVGEDVRALCFTSFHIPSIS
jgi:plasmid stabilization system protein ParE